MNSNIAKIPNRETKVKAHKLKSSHKHQKLCSNMLRGHQEGMFTGRPRTHCTSDEKLGRIPAMGTKVRIHAGALALAIIVDNLQGSAHITVLLVVPHPCDTVIACCSCASLVAASLAG